MEDQEDPIIVGDQKYIKAFSATAKRAAWFHTNPCWRGSTGWDVPIQVSMTGPGRRTVCHVCRERLVDEPRKIKYPSQTRKDIKKWD